MSTPRVWYDFYKAALLETDPMTIRDKIQAAESAIRDREYILSQDHGGTAQERQSLADAKHSLEILRRESAEWQGQQVLDNRKTSDPTT